MWARLLIWFRSRLSRLFVSYLLLTKSGERSHDFLLKTWVYDYMAFLFC